MRPGPRDVVKTEWESVFRIGGAESDTTLYDVSFIQADSAGVYVYDPGRYQVIRISTEGEVRWAFGGRGKGPNEFMRVRDLELDPGGRLWILDPENTRITVLAPSGGVEMRIPIRDIPSSDQLAPIDRGRAILVGSVRQRPLFLIDRRGVVVERLDIPWPGLRKLHPLAAQMLTAAGPNGSYFALAFRMGNGFFVFKDKNLLPFHGIFVEHTEFPDVERFTSGRSRTLKVLRTADAAVSMVVRNDRIYVHFGGLTEDRYALIDVYVLGTGEYERTIVLPRPVGRIAIGDDIVYGVYTDPYPVLEAWRPRAGDL